MGTLLHLHCFPKKSCQSRATSFVLNHSVSFLQLSPLKTNSAGCARKGQWTPGLLILKPLHAEGCTLHHDDDWRQSFLLRVLYTTSRRIHPHPGSNDTECFLVTGSSVLEQGQRVGQVQHRVPIIHGVDPVLTHSPRGQKRDTSRNRKQRAAWFSSCGKNHEINNGPSV